MANRSYLYALSNRPTSYADRPETIGGVSEWAYDVPFAYRVLLSGDPQPCASLVSDGLEDDRPDHKTRLYAVSADFEAGFARFQKLARTLKPIAGSALAAALDESIAFLEPHRDRYLLLETIELDLMSQSGEKALRECVDREIERCRKVGAAMDALSDDPTEAGRELLAAAERERSAPLDALFGLTLDGFDDVRGKRTRCPLGVSYWSEVLYFGLWSRAKFEAAQAKKRAEAAAKPVDAVDG